MKVADEWGRMVALWDTCVMAKVMPVLFGIFSGLTDGRDKSHQSTVRFATRPF
jgi:hypothetical protein